MNKSVNLGIKEWQSFTVFILPPSDQELYPRYIGFKEEGKQNHLLPQPVNN